MQKTILVTLIFIFTTSSNLFAISPSFKNLSYGPHQRNQLDLWIAETENNQSSPVLVCIHGGGFRRGDKSKFANNKLLLKTMLESGISVAAINYRRTDGGKNPYPAPMHDAARAIQYLRFNAEKYNLDKSRIIATGGSAGGCMSLWLAFHDDLADPDNPDPVLRESTRLTAAVPHAGQTCLHLPTLCDWFEVDSLIEHPGGRPLFGVPPGEKLEQNKKLEKISLDASPITHLSKDDPAVYMSYPANQPVNEQTDFRIWVHHPTLGMKLKESMDTLGIECHLLIKDGPQTKPYTNEFEFIIAKLTQK